MKKYQQKAKRGTHLRQDDWPDITLQPCHDNDPFTVCRVTESCTVDDSVGKVLVAELPEVAIDRPEGVFSSSSTPFLDYQKPKPNRAFKEKHLRQSHRA